MKVRLKLALLAGVPVLGALLLSVLIARDASQRAATAAALGSIDDLAQLTEQMTNVVHRLRVERAQSSYSAGVGEKISPDVAGERLRTDEALRSLTSFLAQRDESKLPPKLKRDLGFARDTLTRLGEFRAMTEQEHFRIDEYLDYFAMVNDALIGATAALTQLSDDGELLRNISHLVATMQVVERRSRAHALLSYVLGVGEFPPGTFRAFVTSVTEQDVYAASLQTTLSDADFQRLKEILTSPAAKRIDAMRKQAIEATDEHLTLDANDWFVTERSNLEELRRVERETADAVRAAASKKVAETKGAIRLGVGLAIGVVLTSSLLGWAIARSMTRSVRVLSEATEAVQAKEDFSIRAVKTSSDELGLLTDAFNGMLAGIQERDSELLTHRQNLEALVDARTRQLSERNEQMRLVLDSVEQGLAMIDREGRLLSECSRVFAEWFGVPEPGKNFAGTLAKGDDATMIGLQLGYEQIIDDVLPLALALEQMPKRVAHGARHFALTFQTVLRQGKVDRTLLVVRDITAELAARRLEALQREKITTFEHVMRDRFGFLEFLTEARILVERVRDDDFPTPIERARAVHTLKGINSVFEVKSIADVAHELEQALGNDERDLARELTAKLVSAWDEYALQIVPVLGDERGVRVEMTRSELDGVIAMARSREEHAVIEHALVRLRREPAHLRFKRIEEQLKGMALRLGKGEPLVFIDAGDVRISASTFREFWSSFAHVVRNVADHGMETEQERLMLGKPARNRVELKASSDERALRIEIADDGRGIDWSKLANKARERFLPYETRADLVRAMLTDGVSTAGQVTEISGRGVGMSAVFEACSTLRGEIIVESEFGRGTRFRFVFPSIEKTDARPSLASSAPPPTSPSMRPPSRRSG